MSLLQQILTTVDDEFADAFNLDSFEEAEDVLSVEEFDALAIEVEAFVVEKISEMTSGELMDALHTDPSIWENVLSERKVDIEHQKYVDIQNVEGILKAALIRVVLSDVLGVNPY